MTIRLPADATVVATLERVIAQRPPIRELFITFNLINREREPLWFMIPARAQAFELEAMGVFIASAFSVGAKGTTRIIALEGSAASHVILVSPETSITLRDVR